MLPPVLVTPPAERPLTLAEVKAHLRVDHDEEDALIGGLLDAAVSHLDGWRGILGRCLVTQTWRQDFAGWADLWLPFPDVQGATVTYRDGAGAAQTVDTGDVLVEPWGGRYGVRFVSGWGFPALLTGGAAPVSVTVTAGFGGAEDVPWALKAAILLHVGTLYQHRETLAPAAQTSLTGVYEALIASFRVVRP